MAGTWSNQQQAAISARGNVLVSAGAGSGKTTVLVERLAQRVLDPTGPDMDQLLVVTFTEAAAAEMRNRIGERLEAARAAAVACADHAAARRADRQLALLERAQISTLHSFCLEVVRRNFLTLGIEPVFHLLGEEDRRLLRQQVFDAVFEEQLHGPAAESLTQVLLQFCQGDPDQLADLVSRLDAFSRSQPWPESWLAGVADAYRQVDGAMTQWPWTPAFLQWVELQLAAARGQLAALAREAAAVPELAAYADDAMAGLQGLDEALAALAGVQAGTGRATVGPGSTGTGAEGSGSGDPAAAALAAVAAAVGGWLRKKGSPRAPANPAWDPVKKLRKRVREQLDELWTLISRGVDAFRQDVASQAPLVAALLGLVLAFQRAYSERKRQTGRLDFDDLEHLAFQVLCQPDSGEAAQLQARFVEVYVDEYQDTSPIQEAILAAVARPEGNVFAVGDVKQSIYRFRMAEPNLFVAKYRAYQRRQGGQALDLTDNYRSRPELVEAVNFVFAQLLTPELGGVDYRTEGAMTPARTLPPAGEGTEAVLELHLVERHAASALASAAAADLADHGSGPESEGGATREADAEDSGIDPEVQEWAERAALEKEALVAAARIRAWQGADGQPPLRVWDRKANAWRPVQYRDIAILLRASKGKLETVLEVLQRAGIPAYGQASRGFYQALEVQWVLAALAVLDNPLRDLPLWTLLRSPLAGFDDEELARIRLAQRHGPVYRALRRVARGETEAAWAGLPGWDGRTPADAHAALVAKVQTLLRRLRGWRELARHSTAAAVVKQVLDDTGLWHYVAGMPGGDGRVANLRALLDKATAYDRAHAGGVFGFYAWVDEVRTEGDEGEARTLGENEDVVRVLTIHQSKGLEFPVVLVLDLGKGLLPPTAQGVRVRLHRTLGLGAERVDWEGEQRWPTLPLLAVEAQERLEALAEEARILYVAMTRARDRLVLIGSAQKLVQRAVRWWQVAQTTEPVLHGLDRLQASSWLDWLVPVWMRHVSGEPLRALAAAGLGEAAGLTPPVPELAAAPVAVHVHLWGVLGRPLPQLPGMTRTEAAPVPWDEEAFRRGDLPSIRAQLAARVKPAEALAGAGSGLTVVTPVPPAAVLPGKLSATDLRRVWSARQPGAGRQGMALNPAALEHLLEDPALARAGEPLPRERGEAFHRMMQRIDLTLPPAAAVAACAQALVAAGELRREHVDAALLDDCLALLTSALGQRLVRARRVWRELPFLQRLQVGDTFAVVQGVMDCLADEGGRWLLLDYKTDRIRAEDVPQQAAEYAAQVAVYRAAAEAALGQPVEAFLYFVRPRMAVAAPEVDVSGLFAQP